MKKIIAFMILFSLLALNVRAESELHMQLAPTTRVVLPNGLTLLIRERHDAAVDREGPAFAVRGGPMRAPLEAFRQNDAEVRAT